MEQRHAEALQRLTASGLSVVEGLEARLGAAETDEAVQRLTMAYARACRSVRHSIALEARLVRDAERQHREAEELAAREARARAGRLKRQVKAEVERQIWNEVEDAEEAERLVDELGERLDVDELSDGFGEQSMETHIARLCEALGVTPEDPHTPEEPEAAAPDGEGADYWATPAITLASALRGPAAGQNSS